MISISIIIPIYNVEQYVQRCLESVFAQDGIDADIECIIIDDCTPDNSMAVVRQMLSDFNGSIIFKIIEHGKNRGLSAVRNTGLLYAKGDYIFFMDSDDYLMPGSFNYFIEYMKLYPNIDMVMGNAKNCKNGDFLIHHIYTPWLIKDCNIFFQLMLRHQIYLYAWNKLIRRDLLIKNDIYFEEGILYEDQCWSYELFSYFSSILLLPKVTYIYENNPLSIVNTSFSPDRSDLVLRSYTISIHKMLDMPPNPKKYRKNMIVDYLLFMMYYMMNGIDIMFHCPVTDKTIGDFKKVRKRLLVRSFRYGRLLLSCFFSLLFPPLSYIQKVRFFRHHYYDMDIMINRLCHLLDFLHNKNRI